MWLQTLEDLVANAAMWKREDEEARCGE